MLEAPRQFPLIPTDMAKMPTYMGMEVPKPSIEHTLVKCDVCEVPGWIGPAQLAAITFGGGMKICYWCLFRQMQVTGGNMEIHGLDRTADSKPRRT